jgi:transposase
MGWTDVRGRVERPGSQAWVGVSPELRAYVYALEHCVKIVDAEQFWRGQLHASELAGRDRLLIEKDAQIARLEQENLRLRETSGLTSRNSSKPPSSDPPSAPKRVLKRPTGKRRGGQPGHPKHERVLVPVAACAEVSDHKPAACERCQAPLRGEDPEPLRHQTVELPVVEPLVVEHRLHSLRCVCGHTTRAVLPEGTNPTGFGPHIEATVATLAGACRLSHRTIVSVMADLFRVSLGVGTVTKILRRVSAAVAEPVDEARASIAEADAAKHVDETTWYQRGADGTNEDGRRAWLWVAVTASIVAFRVTLSRSRSVAREVIGTLVSGVLVSDRYPAYAFVGVTNRQLCWAHLKREFVRISERRGASGRVGRGLVKVAEEVFAAWHAYQEGKLETEAWHRRLGALRQQAREWLEMGSRFDVRAHERSERTRTKNTCRELLKVEAAMWTFLRRPDVALTNNVAERSLRHAVLWRRASFGSQSEDGAEGVARLLTVVMTRRAQGKSAHEYFVAACEAARERRAPPRLVA